MLHFFNIGKKQYVDVQSLIDALEKKGFKGMKPTILESIEEIKKADQESFDSNEDFDAVKETIEDGFNKLTDAIEEGISELSSLQISISEKLQSDKVQESLTKIGNGFKGLVDAMFSEKDEK